MESCHWLQVLDHGEESLLVVCLQLGEARRDELDVAAAKQGFHATHTTVVQLLQRQDCPAKSHHDGTTYGCTQLNLLKRVLSFRLWKDQKHCVWPGTFEQFNPPFF